MNKVATEAVHPEDYPDQLIFKVNDKEVCQRSFANMIGMATVEGFKNKLWVDEVSIFLNKKERHTDGKQNGKNGFESSRKKREHAYAYVLKLVNSQIVDKSAHKNYDNHLYLPYHTLTSLFDEYVYLCRREKLSSYAQRSTFAIALKQVKKDKKKDNISIRLSGGKGIYPIPACCLA